MSENKMPDRIFLSAEAIMDFAINDATEAYKERDDCFPTEYIRADLVPKWISVSERLPEHSYQKSNCYDVACKNASAKYTGCAFIGADARWYSSNGDRRKGVTHWRERPTYPEEA